jgi:very-short-patch-repair endonuclease
MSNQSEKTLKFIEKARAKHGDKYEYSEVNYTSAKNKVCITCKTHGIFEQTPTNHLTGFGCNLCANNKRIDTAEFIKRAKAVHGDRYDYSKAVYVNADTPLIVICAKHCEFTSRPDFHINRKTGCAKCSGNAISNTADFIALCNKIHGNKYDYSKVNYINNRVHVTIICSKHGEFQQIPYSHTRLSSRVGCPHCINKTEFEMYQTLKSLFPTVIHQYKVNWCKNRQCLPYDFCIPELKVIIELDGEQHFKQVAKWRSPDAQLQTDMFKMKCANNNGFSVIRVAHSLVNGHTAGGAWLNTLLSHIETIKTAPQPANYYVCEGAKYNYDKHVEGFISYVIPDASVIDTFDTSPEIDADDLDTIDENDTNDTNDAYANIP